MLKMLMNNPYAWLLLSLCTIASLIFAIYTWALGKKIKEISIDRYTNEIVKIGINSIKKLEMKFDGKAIHDLSSTIFFVWNSGNDVINDSDMVGEIPIKITCEDGEFLDVKLIKQSDKSNAFHILNFNSKNIEIAFDYIDGGEGLKFQILHTGSGEKIHVEYKIKGGQAKRDCAELRKKVRKKEGIKLSIDELMPMIALIFGIFVSSLLFNLLEITSENLILLFLVFSGLFALIFLFIYRELKSKIREILHRAIPDTLKNGK